jgi:hypothetical protein
MHSSALRASKNKGSSYSRLYPQGQTMPEPAISENRFSPFRLIQTAAFILFASVSVAIAMDLVEAANHFGYVWAIPILAVAAYASADLLSGIVHYLADNFGSPDTPFLGKAFVMPFRDHHTNPEGILEHPFMIANGNNCLVTTPPLLAVAFFVPITTSVAGYLFATYFLFLFIGVLLTNQFHKWAHMPSPPKAVRWLQDKGIVLSKEHHDVHHTSPFDTYYCITTGWWNPLLERLGIFEKITAFVRRPLLSSTRETSR